MPLVNYRGSEEAVLHEIHEVAGRRQSAKQVLKQPQGREYLKWNASISGELRVGIRPYVFHEREGSPLLYDVEAEDLVHKHSAQLEGDLLIQDMVLARMRLIIDGGTKCR